MGNVNYSETLRLGCCIAYLVNGHLHVVLSLRAHAHKVTQTASTRAPSDNIILSSWPDCSGHIVYLRPLESSLKIAAHAYPSRRKS